MINSTLIAFGLALTLYGGSLGADALNHYFEFTTDAARIATALTVQLFLLLVAFSGARNAYLSSPNQLSVGFVSLGFGIAIVAIMGIVICQQYLFELAADAIFTSLAEPK